LQGAKKAKFFNASHGVGAVCEVLLKNLHNRPILTANFPNALASEHLDGLL
jgi:hypothetical protein